MSIWHPDEHGLVNTGDDFTMGEGQVSSEWSVRLVRDDDPCVHVDVTAAARTDGAGASGSRRFYPEVRVTYRMFTDPADPGGSQAWEEEQADAPGLCDYPACAEADREARDLIGTYIRDPDGLLMDWPPHDSRPAGRAAGGGS